MNIFLTTDRLILAIPHIKEIDEIVRLQFDPEVMKYIGDGARSRTTVESFLNMAITHFKKHGFSFCSVYEKVSNNFIGQAGLIYLGFDENQPDIEVGYRLHKEYWGKGYATELTSALILWAFQHLSIEKLVAVAHPDNINSQKVLIKAGMINTGTISYWNKEVLSFEIIKPQKMDPVIRRATTVDTNAIANVYLRSRKELVSFAPLVHTDKSIYQWVRNTLIPEEQVFVAENRGIIIGMMSLTKDEEVGRIKQLYILPDAVGHGVGTLMIKKAKSILGSPIQLYTFQENFGAKRFYERHGFQAIEFDDGSGNEENCPAVLYEWVI